MIVIWILIIALIVWGATAPPKRGSYLSGTSCKVIPLEIARGRYAKGEITKEEYEEIKKNLS